MNKIGLIILLVAAPLSAATAAIPVDNYASDAIARQDFVAAEARLNDYLRRNHDDPPAMLNLAYVYRQTRRESQANALYHRVLARLDTNVTRLDNGGAVSSHDVAIEALQHKTRLAQR